MARKDLRKICILVFGLPGHGKTEFATELSHWLDCHHINADYIRNSPISRDLGFAVKDRILQAERMGTIADIILYRDNLVILDFVCPTKETRRALANYVTGETFLFKIFMDKDAPSRFPDTAKLFERPTGDETVLSIPAWETTPQMIEMVRKLATEINKYQRGRTECIKPW